MVLFLVTAVVVGWYPSMPHSVGLNALKSTLKNWKKKQITTSNLHKMTQFVLDKNYFEFFDRVYRETSGTAISTKFAPLTLVFTWTT